MSLNSLIPEEPAWKSWPLVLALGSLFLVGLLLLHGWQEEEQERQLQQLATEQARLLAQRQELLGRRQLLAEYEKLTAGEGFYIVLHHREQEGHLRLRDRTLRRFNWRANAGNPPPGRYSLQTANSDTLAWNGFLAVSGTDAEGCEGTGGSASCLVLSPEVFAVLARTLKPGAPLLLLP